MASRPISTKTSRLSEVPTPQQVSVVRGKIPEANAAVRISEE